MKKRPGINLRIAGLMSLLILWALPTSVQCQFTFTTNDDNSLTITGDPGAVGALVIPDSINGLPVTHIGENAFNQSYITSVTLGTNVVCLDEGAFCNCNNLTNATIPNSVTDIGEAAFCNCGLISITIPDSVTNIGVDAFWISDSLTSVNIGAGVIHIGYDAFEDCISLTAITVDPANADYTSAAGVLFDKNLTTLIQYAIGRAQKTYAIPDTVTNLDSQSFLDSQSLTNVFIGGKVINIGTDAFFDCLVLAAITVNSNNPAYSSLDGVLFNKNQTTLIEFPGDKVSSGYAVPNSVTNISDSAFYECTRLKMVTLGNQVAGIGNYAFCYCTSLTNIVFNKSINQIGYSAFDGTGLISVTLPNSITNVAAYLFSECTQLSRVTFGTNVISIGGAAFDECSSLTNITIPKSVIDIEVGAFRGCGSLNAIIVNSNNPAYSSVDGVLFNKPQTVLIQYPAGKAGGYVIPASVNQIEAQAFYFCFALTSVTIPDNVTNLGDGAFWFCWGLTNVTLGHGLTVIQDGAFYCCESLRSITIPDSVTNIGDDAFGGAGTLTVYFQADAPAGIMTMFDYGSSVTVYYVNGSTGWDDFTANTGILAVGLNETIPALAVTGPTTGLQVSNASQTITGTAAGSVAIVNVFYSLNDAAWTTPATASHWTNWSAIVNLIPGTNRLAAFAVDQFGYYSPTSQVSWEYILNTTLTVRTNGHGTISPDDNGAWLPIGENVTLTAAPLPGYEFKNWTGSRPTNNATLTFMMASNLTLTANFVAKKNPTLSIKSPRTGQVFPNPAVTVTGKASDNVAVAAVMICLNAGNWTNAQTANGWKNWTAGLTLAPGNNTFSAYAVDAGGNRSKTNNIVITYSQPAKAMASLPPPITKIKLAVRPADARLQFECGNSPAFVRGGFQAKLTGPADTSVVIECSPDLVHWEPIQTNSVTTNGILVTIPMTSQPCQFIRAHTP